MITVKEFQLLLAAVEEQQKALEALFGKHREQKAHAALYMSWARKNLDKAKALQKEKRCALNGGFCDKGCPSGVCWA